MKQKKTLTKEELEKRKKTLRIFKIIMIIFDLFAVGIMVYQIINKNINLSSYVVLLICNVATFIMKPDSFC